MCRRGPLTFADDGQSGAVTDEVQAGARAGAPKREGEMLTASRERGVIGCREIDAQQPEDRGQEALGLTQRYVEEETERQGGFDGEIGILELPAPPADASRCPRGDRVRREPEGDVASPHEGAVVLGPVPDAIRCLVLRMHSRLHIEIMTRRRSRWATCRPLLAHRAESAHQRRFEAAAEGIEGIRYQFEQRNRFPDDVKFTLAMVENNVKTLRAKYGCLVAGHIDSEDDAKSAVSHLNRFFLASLQDIQVDVLRLYLTLQNDPDFVEPCQSQLRKKIERYGKDFRQILDDDLVGAFHRTLKGDLAGSKWSHLPHGLRRLFGGELAARVRNVRVIRKDFNSVQTRIMRWIDAFESATDESREQSIVFYREPDGERTLRAYHTRDVRLQQAAA